MSDDFDKLRPTGDEDDSDDDSLDWLREDKPKKPGEGASGKDLGFTGELSWKQGVEDAFNEQLAATNEDAFDWQQKQQDKPGSSASQGGFTGELDWKKVQQSGDVPDAGGDAESLDWLKNTDEEEPASEALDYGDPFADAQPAQQPEPEDDPLAWMNQYTDIASDEPAQSEPSFFDEEDDELFATPKDQLDEPIEQDDPLSWLNQFSAGDEAASQPPPGSEAAAPSWLDEAEDAAPAVEDDADLPPWLSSNMPAEKPITEGGKLSEDWLAGAEDAPETAQADMSFDQWQQIQTDLTRPRDADEEMPDLFSEMNSAPPVGEGDLPANETGQLPSWVLGMNELDADKAPDWLSDEPETTQSSAADDIFADLDLPPAEPEPQVDFGDDPFAGLNLGDDDAPDWLRDSAPQSASPEQPPPSVPVPDDIFAELGISTEEPQSTYDFPDDPLAGLNLGGDETPDWLSASAPQSASPVPPAASNAPDDIFAELGLSSPQTGYDFLDNPEPAADPLAGLNLGASADSPDWFTEAEQPAAEKDTPDWLSQLGDLSEAAGATTVDSSLASADLAPAEDDFLAELRGSPRQPAPDIDPLDTSGLQDIDSLLASYDDAMALPSTGELTGGDMDSLLSEDDLEQISARRTDARPSASMSGLSPDAPDWLSELGANVDEVSAAAIVRKQTQRERPLDELSDRLQALHDRGLEMPTAEDARPSEVLRTLLPGVTEVLPAAPMQPGKGVLIGDLVLTDAQREKMNLLKSLVGTDEERRPVGKPSAIDLTLATPNFADLDDEEPDFAPAGEAAPLPVPAAAVRARTRRRLPKVDRLLIALFLSVAVILPYVVSSLRIGDLPPAQFAAGSRQEKAFAAIDNLHRGDVALIAAEYGPTGAGELDPALDALLRHVLMRGARPIIVSGNPVGLLHARNVMNSIIDDSGFLRLIDRPSILANRDYYVVRYLAASTIGLRSFSQDIPGMLAVDANGQATNLGMQSLQDFAVIAVIAESAEELRGWAEQVAPLAGKPLIAVTGQSAAPLSEPYVLPESPERISGLSGMLVGYKDAYTYRSILDTRLTGGAVAPIPPTETPTEVPAVVPEATVEGGAASAETTTEAGATSESVASPTPEGANPTGTQPPTSTPQPSDTPAPTATPTDTPTATFTPSITPTFEPAVNVRGVIDSDQSVNVREGPGRTFAPVASLAPGSIVQITGRNGDGTWLKIQMDDGTEGWVSASLVGVEGPPQATEEAPQTGMNIDLDNQMVGLISDINLYAPAAQDATPEPETTGEAVGAESTAETTLEATTESSASPTPAVPAAPAVTPNRDERWYGMTLGLVAVIVVITFGMIVNILRGLFRRGK